MTPKEKADEIFKRFSIHPMPEHKEFCMRCINQDINLDRKAMKMYQYDRTVKCFLHGGYEIKNPYYYFLRCLIRSVRIRVEIEKLFKTN